MRLKIAVSAVRPRPWAPLFLNLRSKIGRCATDPHSWRSSALFCSRNASATVRRRRFWISDWPGISLISRGANSAVGRCDAQQAAGLLCIASGAGGSGPAGLHCIARLRPEVPCSFTGAASPLEVERYLRVTADANLTTADRRSRLYISGLSVAPRIQRPSFAWTVAAHHSRESARPAAQSPRGWMIMRAIPRPCGMASAVACSILECIVADSSR